MQRQLLLLTLLLLQIAARGQTGYEYRYWFDHDGATLQTGHTATSSWTMSADVSGLSETLHAIHVQVTDADGVSSAPVSRYFVKTPYRSTAKGIYWYDTEKDKLRESSQMEGAFDIDVSDLPEGFHTLHYQVKGTDGSLSAIASKGFIKTPKVKGADYLNCLCMIDDQLYKQEQVSAQGDVINWDIDVSSLPYGVHRIFIQVVTPMGAASAAYQTFFMRATTTTELSQMKCYYAVDGDVFSSQTGHLSGDAFHFDLDVSSLTDGLHKLTCMLSNGTVTTEVQSQYFMKTPVGGDGIVKYEYWLNDADDQKKEVTLSQRTYPFSLITLLPVDRQPIRSQLFQFRVEQDKPVVYAKNDFHIRFYDAAGRFTDVIKQYVDEQVRQEVTDVTPINNGDHKTVQTPGKNEIRWFKFDAEEGDTVSFRTDQAATLQVFSPEGKEIYSAQGSTSVIYGGCHTWSKGTYYVALHDVMGSRAKISLDYSHMDKYDVVRQDINVVGNGGCSTIAIDGNGFRDLYSVDLFTAQGDSIHHVDIGHESDAQTSLTFDFSDAALGEYDAVFHFTTEDKVFHKFVTVEEARDIELATTVTYPSTFLRGTSTTYTVKITNKGNMTAYMVPIYSFIQTKTENAISEMSVTGMNLPSFYDLIDTDSLSEALKAVLKDLSNGLSDLHYYMCLNTTDEVNGDSVCIRSNQFFTEIAPQSTKIIQFSIKSSETTHAFFTVPEDWNSLIMGKTSQLSSRRRVRRSSLKDQYCCIRERVECIGNITVNVLDLANTIVPGNINLALVDCAAGLINQTITAIGTLACDEDESRFKTDFVSRLRRAASGISVAGAVFSCLDFIDVPNVGDLVHLCNALTHPLTTYDCIKSFVSKKPGCPPTPPNGGSSTPQPPSDPNDIYGYLAESGSKFIADSVEKVNYTIEFENDTTFAMASAHTIAVRDTLDSRYFKLDTFLPTGIKLGGHDVFLSDADVTTKNGNTTFVKTIDVRPEINAIAQVEGAYNSQTGIAEWRFTSLDPMTMEPTDDLMQGILPVNYDGTSGIGEVYFEIGMKRGKSDGTEIANRAGIVFDYEDAIITPTWTNIVDGTAPESRATNVVLSSDSTAVIGINATDELSGVWRYDVYVQYGIGSAWWKAAENVPLDSAALVKVYDGIDHGFYVVATDSAGNVEQKNAEREFSLVVGRQKGDVNNDGMVGIADIVAITNYIVGTATGLTLGEADVNNDGQVGIADIVAVTDMMAGTNSLKAKYPKRYQTYFLKGKQIKVKQQ